MRQAVHEATARLCEGCSAVLGRQLTFSEFCQNGLTSYTSVIISNVYLVGTLLLLYSAVRSCTLCLPPFGVEIKNVEALQPFTLVSSGVVLRGG